MRKDTADFCAPYCQHHLNQATSQFLQSRDLKPYAATTGRTTGKQFLFQVHLSASRMPMPDILAKLWPGGPPKWSPPPLPFALTQDAGHQFTAQTSLRVPEYPFEPVFQAMSILNPDVQLDAVDLILNRNSLRKLLDYAAGKRQDPFCMGLDMVKNTLFISRKEKHARMMIHGAPDFWIWPQL